MRVWLCDMVGMLQSRSGLERCLDSCCFSWTSSFNPHCFGSCSCVD